ncbi:hypothetical protein [Luteimonas salinilitoris]|uniref:Uncharacterized protein n=1 Tax=Luteimonas salinilitoris TaxID=3237697 RepID=A0ABV4HTQ3_9GAMM
MRFVLAGVCALLMSCSRSEVATVEEDAAVIEMGVAAMIDRASTSADLPKACEDYAKRVEACIGRIDGHPSASSLEDSLDHARSQWAEAPDAHALASSCKAANKGFAETAATTGCE